jgi:glucokinase
LVGAWGLVKSAEEALSEGKAPILKQVMQEAGVKRPSPKILADAAKKGDRFSKELWKEAGDQLGTALSNIVNLLNPDRIVLCGGVSKAGAMILTPALASLRSRAFDSPRKAAKVSISHYDERLGVVGAALLFWESKDI